LAFLLQLAGLPVYGNGIRILLDVGSGRAITLIPSSLAHSTPLNRRSENVVIKAVIIPELELSNIEVKVLFVDVVEGSDDAALEGRPRNPQSFGYEQRRRCLA
jgi:hypothetical protein